MNTSSSRTGLALHTVCGLLTAMALGCAAQLDEPSDEPPVDTSQEGVNGCAYGGITVFEDANYQGRSLNFCEGSFPDLTKQSGGLNSWENWNDRISSLKAFGTYNRSIRLRVYQDANYQAEFSGFPHTFTRDDGIPTFDALHENDHMSSFQIEGSSNLIANPSFEDLESWQYAPGTLYDWNYSWRDDAGWFGLVDWGAAYDGKNFMRINHVYDKMCLAQSRPAAAGEYFSASVWVRRHSGQVGGQGLTLAFYAAGSNTPIAKVKNLAGSSMSWNQLLAAKVAPPGTARVRFAIGACDQGSWPTTAVYDYDQAVLTRL